MSWVRIPPSPHFTMKKYSIDEAQILIKKIHPIVKDIKAKAHDYSRYHIEASRLVANFRNSPYDRDGVLDKIMNTRKELRDIMNQLEGYSVILRDIEHGTVDILSQFEEDEVMLCCRIFEESEIGWFHNIDEPCSRRRPLKKED